MVYLHSQLIECSFGSQLSSRTMYVSDKSTLLSRHYRDGAKLAVLVKVIAKVLLQHLFTNVANVQGGDGFVFRRVQTRKCGSSAHQFLGHRIVGSVITIFNVLIGQWIVRVGWFLVTVGAFFSSLAFTLDPKRADVRQVPTVIGGGASQLHQQIRRRVSF